jgi:predicted nucleotidyltransferase
MEMKVRTRDFIHTTDDLFFASTNYVHPENRVICFLRYIPNPEGDREKNGKKYSKVDSEGAYTYLKENYPEYLFFDEVTQVKDMMGVPLDKIAEIIKPEERLREIREEYIPKFKDKDNNSLSEEENLLRKLIDLSDFFHYKADISYDNLGISGSICPNLQKKGTSDLDFVVYGLENHRNAVRAYKKFKDQEVEIPELNKKVTLNRIGNDFFERVYQKRIKDDSLGKDEFCWYENRKSNRGVIDGTLFDILATRNYDEINGYYGDTCFEPLGNATVTCTITNALESFDNPAVYEIGNVKHVDGVDVDISGLASFTHTYAGEVLEGEEVIARGKVEKVLTDGKPEWYRIVVGTTREALNEFIKLEKSPVE